MRAPVPVWMALGAAVVLLHQPAGPLSFVNAATSTGDRAIFEPLRPTRLYDTRTAAHAPALTGPATRPVPVTTRGGVPADATAAALTITVLKPTKAGYVIAYPAGQVRPTAFTLNYVTGVSESVNAALLLGTGGAVSLYLSAGTAHVVVEVTGFYRAHDHDDRYYTKAATQARLAGNSLTCAAGQLIRAVAADGTPTCVAQDAHDHDVRYYTKSQAQARTAASAFTCSAGQVLQSAGADGAPSCVAQDAPRLPSPFLGIPGGNLVVGTGATFTMSNDAFYETATLGANSVVKTNGHRLFVRGTLTMSAGSSINRDGNPGTLTGAGAAHAPGSLGGSGAGACSVPGGAVANSFGGAGSNMGAAASAATRPVPAVGGLQLLRYTPQALIGRTLDTAYITGGAGGGGGTCSGNAPGGGGGGGGVVVVGAGRIVVPSGIATISADGGSSVAAGGGGGGLVVLAVQEALPAGLTVRANGGTSGGNSSWAGAPGIAWVIAL